MLKNNLTLRFWVFHSFALISRIKIYNGKVVSLLSHYFELPQKSSERSHSDSFITSQNVKKKVTKKI